MRPDLLEEVVDGRTGLVDHGLDRCGVVGLGERGRGEEEERVMRRGRGEGGGKVEVEFFLSFLIIAAVFPPVKAAL